MTTVSVPLPADLLEALENFIKRTDSNKAAIVREALRMYLDEQAVNDVLRASREPRLEGNLRTLAKKL